MIKTIASAFLQILSILFSSILGIIHLAILISLGSFGVITGLLTIAMPIFGLLRAFGADNFFIIWNDSQIPEILGLPAGVFLGVICASLSWLCFRVMIKYFHRISK